MAPAELEAVLLTHPDVTDAAVIGLPEPAAGEVPYAWVVRQPDSRLTESQLIQFVDGNVVTQYRDSSALHSSVIIDVVTQQKLKKKGICLRQ